MAEPPAADLEKILIISGGIYRSVFERHLRNQPALLSRVLYADPPQFQRALSAHAIHIAAGIDNGIPDPAARKRCYRHICCVTLRYAAQVYLNAIPRQGDPLIGIIEYQLIRPNIFQGAGYLLFGRHVSLMREEAP